MASKKRTETPHEVVKVTNGPDWLQALPEGTEESSLDTMAEYRVLSRVKVFQGLTDQSMQQEFGGPGTVVAVPVMNVIADQGADFRFVPIFGFTEFCVWSDIDDQASPAIIERTFDKGSEIAARARDPQKRFEPYGDLNENGDQPFRRRWVEHLNFAGVIYDEDHDLYMNPLVLSFGRGEFNQGKNFISAMMLRTSGGRKVPMWGQVWQLSSAFRDRGPKKKWWGLDFAVPKDVDKHPAYIQSEEVEIFQALYEQLKEDFERSRLVVDRSDSEEEREGAEEVVDANVTVDM